jgi:hypothetical protein
VANANEIVEIFGVYFSVSFTYRGWISGSRLETIRGLHPSEKKKTKRQGKGIAWLRDLLRMWSFASVGA